MSMEPLKTHRSYEPDIEEMMLSGWRVAMVLNGREKEVAWPYISAMQNLPMYVKDEEDKEGALSELEKFKREFYELFYFPEMPTNLDGLGHVASIEAAYKEAKQKINECS